MKIGFVGYGSMTAALAPRWIPEHDVFIGGRNAAKAATLATSVDAVGHGTEAEAVAFGNVVVLATIHEAVFDAIDAAGGAPAFAGKVVIDINNPVDVQDGDFLVQSIDGGSLCEKLQATLPDAHVVKAFNTCQAAVWQMDPPRFDGRTLVVPLAGDDADAKDTVAELVRAVGCEPVDFGFARHARHVEAIAGAVIRLLFAGRDPHTVLNLIQPERKPID